MRILQLGSFYRESVIKPFNNSTYVSKPDIRSKLAPLQADMVSFSGKNYGVNSIKNPTGHCAYCNAKVYTENELNAMARDLMLLKGNKLQGKIRSVTEKLGNKNSHNALIAKKAEVNKEYIDFFESFAEYSSKYQKMTGTEILKKYFQVEEKKSQEFLQSQLHPLLKTIDHVVPQKEGVDNSDSELNLVESCDTCNRKIKNGMSFQSFNFTYPSIKDEMPKEKFEFATMHLLQTSPSLAADQISSTELMSVIENLIEQEHSAELSLFSIRSKILKSKSNILAAISRIEAEQSEKRLDIDALEQVNTEHSKDEEYEIIKKRVGLTASIADHKRQLSELKQSHSRMCHSVQTWEKKIDESKKELNKSNSGKKNSQSKNEMSVVEMKRKLAESTSSRNDYKRQIDELEPVVTKKESELSALNAEHPDIDILRAEKTRLETLISAHLQLISLQKKQVENKQKRTDLEQQIGDLKEQDKAFSAKKTPPEAQTQEQIEKKKRYMELEVALSQIDSNNQTKEQKLISSFARPQITAEMDSLINEPSVVDYFNSKKHAEIKTTLSTLYSSLSTLKSQDDSITTQIVVQTTLIESNTLNASGGGTEDAGSGLLSCSLDRVKNQLISIDSYQGTLESDIADIPEERTEELPASDEAYQEYLNLEDRMSEINDELCKSISKTDRTNLETEASVIQQRIDELRRTDSKVCAVKNSFDYERLKEQREQLKKGLLSCSSPKERNNHQNQIEALEEQMQELSDKDVTIFNRINSEKREALQSDLDKSRLNKDKLLSQKAEIEKKIEKSSVIGDGFNQEELQNRVDQLAADIKRISEKMIWLEIPEKVTKIRAEISLMEQTIASLRQKINSVKLEDSET